MFIYFKNRYKGIASHKPFVINILAVDIVLFYIGIFYIGIFCKALVFTLFSAKLNIKF